jgi:hypothetical protein
MRKNLLKPEGRIFVKPRLSARELATETRRPGFNEQKSLGLKGRLFIPIDISHHISFHMFSKIVNILLGKKSPYDAPSDWKECGWKSLQSEVDDIHDLDKWL